MTGLSCLSVTAAHASLDVLERLSYRPGELAGRLGAIRGRCGANAVVVLSTCQRTELYASGAYSVSKDLLITALAEDRGLPPAVLRRVARAYEGEAAARHLLRVASGLESFVLGETEIAGQVRAAASISQSAGGGDAVLGRLMDAAIRASRKRHRETSLTAATRSVASVAVDAVIRARGGSIAGQRLLVVGAGQVAGVVVSDAIAQGAEVTVCNRTRRHADRFTAAGAAVADLGELAACLAASDVAVLATGAPEPLVTAGLLRSVRFGREPGPTGPASHPGPVGRAGRAWPLTLVDLSMPRNVDPAVRALPWVRLIDLADLRSAGLADAGELACGLAAADEIIEAELRRYLRWRAGRPAATAVRRMRGGAEEAARQELERIAGELPPELRPAVERLLLRTVHRLVHKPTLELRAAAEAGDSDLVRVLAGLFDAAGGLAGGDLDAAGGQRAAPFDLQRPDVGTAEQAGHEGLVHPAHQLAV